MSLEPMTLSIDQAYDRVLAALHQRWPGASFQIRRESILEREYGWVLPVEHSLLDDETIPCLIAVNKTSGQAVCTARTYPPEEFSNVFEQFLLRTRAAGMNWCLTMSGHARTGADIVFADQTKAAGLFELEQPG
jgi:hypothetical protein